MPLGVLPGREEHMKDGIRFHFAPLNLLLNASLRVSGIWAPFLGPLSGTVLAEHGDVLSQGIPFLRPPPGSSEIHF